MYCLIIYIAVNKASLTSSLTVGETIPGNNIFSSVALSKDYDSNNEWETSNFVDCYYTNRHKWIEFAFFIFHLSFVDTSLLNVVMTTSCPSLSPLTWHQSLHSPTLATLPEEMRDIESEGLSEQHHPNPLVPAMLHFLANLQNTPFVPHFDKTDFTGFGHLLWNTYFPGNPISLAWHFSIFFN